MIMWDFFAKILLIFVCNEFLENPLISLVESRFNLICGIPQSSFASRNQLLVLQNISLSQAVSLAETKSITGPVSLIDSSDSISLAKVPSLFQA